MNALQLCCWKFSHKNQRCSILSSREVHFWRKKVVNMRFWTPFGGLEATYAVHHRLIGKLVVDFLLVITELFFARSTGWGATSEHRLEIAVSEAVGSVCPKISGMGRLPPTILRVGKLDELIFYRVYECRQPMAELWRHIDFPRWRPWRRKYRPTFG